LNPAPSGELAINNEMITQKKRIIPPADSCFKKSGKDLRLIRLFIPTKILKLGSLPKLTLLIYLKLNLFLFLRNGYHQEIQQDSCHLFPTSGKANDHGTEPC